MLIKYMVMVDSVNAWRDEERKYIDRWYHTRAISLSTNQSENPHDEFRRGGGGLVRRHREIRDGKTTVHVVN